MFYFLIILKENIYKKNYIVNYYFNHPFICICGNLSYSQKRELKDAGYSRSDIRKIERGRTDIEPTYKYESISGNRYKNKQPV